jgi:hercynylcysteine S-oxide lyase
VKLPFPDELLSLGNINAKLLDEYNAFAGVFRHNGKWWTRCSAQIWNEVSPYDNNHLVTIDAEGKISDFEYIGKVFNMIAQEFMECRTES